MAAFNSKQGKRAVIAADTNLLVRILVDDREQPEQVAIARKIGHCAIIGTPAATVLLHYKLKAVF